MSEAGTLTQAEILRRLSDPLDYMGRRVCEALAIGRYDAGKASDWAKARAFDDMIALALQIALKPERSIGIDMAREVALAFLETARKGCEDPIPNEPTERPA